MSSSNTSQTLTISDPSSSTYPPSQPPHQTSATASHPTNDHIQSTTKKRYQYPFAFDPKSSSKSMDLPLPSLESASKPRDAILSLRIPKFGDQRTPSPPSNNTTSMNPNHPVSTPGMLQPPNLRGSKRRKRPSFNANSNTNALGQSQISMDCIPNIEPVPSSVPSVTSLPSILPPNLHHDVLPITNSVPSINITSTFPPSTDTNTNTNNSVHSNSSNDNASSHSNSDCISSSDAMTAPNVSLPDLPPIPLVPNTVTTPILSDDVAVTPIQMATNSDHGHEHEEETQNETASSSSSSAMTAAASTTTTSSSSSSSSMGSMGSSVPPSSPSSSSSRCRPHSTEEEGGDDDNDDDIESERSNSGTPGSADSESPDSNNSVPSNNEGIDPAVPQRRRINLVNGKRPSAPKRIVRTEDALRDRSRSRSSSHSHSNSGSETPTKISLISMDCNQSTKGGDEEKSVSVTPNFIALHRESINDETVDVINGGITENTETTENTASTDITGNMRTRIAMDTLKVPLTPHHRSPGTGTGSESRSSSPSTNSTSSSPSSPSSIVTQKGNGKRFRRRQWNEVEDLWLTWICSSVRLRKYETLLPGINDMEHQHFPLRFIGSRCHRRFNAYKQITRCFTTFESVQSVESVQSQSHNSNANAMDIDSVTTADGITAIRGITGSGRTMNVPSGGHHRDIGDWLRVGQRSEDSITQHWRKPLANKQNERGKAFYCLEHGLKNNNDVANQKWNELDDGVQWLYRRGALHRDLLHRFIDTEHYNGKLRGIRIMGNRNKTGSASPSSNSTLSTSSDGNESTDRTTTWLATYRDVKILRFNSRLEAAMGWDQEVRANHGKVIDSNLPLSIREFIELRTRIERVWKEKRKKKKGSRITTWLKLRSILKEEYMDREYGIFPTTKSLHTSLSMVYRWKRAQQIQSESKLMMDYSTIPLEQMEWYLENTVDVWQSVNGSFHRLIECMVLLMIKTAEVASYGFTDHFVVPKEEEKDLLNVNAVTLDEDKEIKWWLFDVGFNLKSNLKRCLKQWIRYPFYPEIVFSAENAIGINDDEDGDQKMKEGVIKRMDDDECPTVFGPDNAMTLCDCKALTDALLAIPRIAAVFGDLQTVSRKLKDEDYCDVTAYLEDLKSIWDDAIGTEHEKLAKKYKALCLLKFELFFEGLTSHRRRSKRLINQNGLTDLRRHLRSDEMNQQNQDQGENATDSNHSNWKVPGTVPHTDWLTDSAHSSPKSPNRLRESSPNQGQRAEGDLLCPRCLKFEGKNSRSLKTHMRYCNKGDVMRYIELSTARKGKDCCECGFKSPVPKGLQSHQLTCELIKRRLNQSHIEEIAPDSKIRMWITTNWYTGTVIEHVPSVEVPHLYRIRFRAKDQKPMKYDLEQYNFRVIPKTKKAKSPQSGTKRKFEEMDHDTKAMDTVNGNERGRGKGDKQRITPQRIKRTNELRPRSKRKKKKRRKVEDPMFVYLHDIIKYRHELFTQQYDAFQNYVTDWMTDARDFLQKID